MSAYVRPTVPDAVYRDDDGRVVHYGERWADGGPPEDAYSRVSHPERFAPLHAVAETLLAHLRSTYDVAVEDDVSVADDLRSRPREVLRAVRLTPADPDAAPLVVVFTSFPGVIVRAGLLHDFPFPICGCDACDERWDDQAGQLEAQVFAVVEGRYRERVRPNRDLDVEYSIAAAGDAGGAASGGTRGEFFPPDRLDAARETLDRLPHGWRAWPRRDAAAVDR
ncbi:DUF6226 family protein [Naasia sp. SYSU D00057]|uniref:DUF6226 family protein n=1 Tax=Naasia sp. SYSU D00057 TaxID=2817380 RepID=UPI001B3128DE|nr:DUF6226 family protein [Naasia sp. SYSU D00057]